METHGSEKEITRSRREPQILVTRDPLSSAKQPASSDWPEQISPLVHSSQTAWQLFNLGQSLEIRFPHLLGHVG